ncbi:MAG: Asp-tRNA(Asn)/Glu-tRNA(Gln) amidotransferase subunit GatA [Planctomycetota bacterium]
MSLIDKTAAELLRHLAAGDVTSEQVTKAYCDRIEAQDSRVQAFLHFDPRRALEQAAAVDAKRRAGHKLGKLAGLPVAVKDVLCTRGERTSCGSKILQDFLPPYDAHVISRLRDEDAVLLGRVNMDEFAMGSSTENSAYAKTRNPWDLERIPGGSSGGSAAAVAASMAPLSIGTDTGGSVRQPAGYCGVVGMKPTYGRVSRYGLVAFASSLDQIGPMAWTVEDAAILLEVLAGHDPRDATCASREVPEYSKTVRTPIEGLKIGIVPEFFGSGLDPQVESAVKSAIDVLKKQGAKIVEVALPRAKYAIATYYIVATAEASSNLARYDGVHYGWRSLEFSDMVDMYSRTRGEGFGAEVKRRIMLGTFVLSAGYRDAYYVKALQVRRLIKEDFDRAFEKVDVIAGPVAPTPAFKLGEKVDDPLAMYLSDIYTVSTNLAGNPGISVPCGFTKSGLPIGLHLQAGSFGEETLLRVGHMLQSHTDWHERRPALQEN